MGEMPWRMGSRVLGENLVKAHSNLQIMTGDGKIVAKS